MRTTRLTLNLIRNNDIQVGDEALRFSHVVSTPRTPTHLVQMGTLIWLWKRLCFWRLMQARQLVCYKQGAHLSKDIIMLV